MITRAFWLILGLGLAIPSTGIIIFNLIVKSLSGDQYELKLTKLGIVYAVSLIGWAISFGIK